MTVPVHAKIWTISANNRIVFDNSGGTGLRDTMRAWLFGMKQFLKANGYTVKGSSNTAAGAMDGVDRWATAADVGTVVANTTTPVSWVVLTDGNGTNICLAYVGGSADIARIAYSPSGAYVAAGTPTHTPTATDEQVIVTGVSLILATTSLDRIWFGWVDSEAKLCRFVICRDSVMVGVAWGVEAVSARATITFSPAVWGFCFTAASFSPTAFLNTFSANTRGGRTRINGASVDCGGGGESFLGSTITWQTTKPELQKAIGAPMVPLSIGSSTATRQGPVGDLYDWYTGYGQSLVGNVYFGGTWVEFGTGTSGGPSTGLAWPWDGLTETQLA